jgi:dTDP-4-amino-4,6-dideoxygalactose transaminase
MINVIKTYLPNIKKYYSYIQDIYSSGILTNNGKYVQLLEKKLQDYLHVSNLLLVTNGTIALQIAYKLLKLKGNVITTPFSFPATTSTLVWENLIPSFFDINKETFCLDLDVNTDYTNYSAVVPVHVFGNACNVVNIESIAEKNNLKVIYDASHAFGVTYNNESILKYGDISTLSFHATKLFHTIEGGAIIINDPLIYEEAKYIRNFGITNLYSVEYLGINGKMNELSAAMGLCVLDDIDYILESRQEIYEHYHKQLKNIVVLQKIQENTNKNYYSFPIILESESKVLQLVELLNSYGINPRRYFYPLLDTLPYIANTRSYPNAEFIVDRILCLPIYPGLSKQCLDIVIKCVYEVVQ